ncbi:MAG: helix-turn-helix domain-containing protein, partial [Chitinophagaceae bacterium]
SESFFHRIEEVLFRQLFLPFDNQGIQIPEQMIKPLEALFNLILLEQEELADISLLLKYTSALLFQLQRFGKHRLSVAAGNDARITRLFQIMSDNFKEHRHASFYAEKIGVSAKRINEILRSQAGVTMSQLLNELLVIESKRELYHGDRSIKEIAYLLGFTDQSYFARFFKKHMGTNPENFREQFGRHASRY